MDKPVRAHIESLQKRLETLTAKQMTVKSKAESNDIERDVRAVKMALAHYMAALELEQTLKP